MDVLKRELQRKRQLIDADFGGRKVLRRAEIEAREIQRLRAAERERLLEKQRKREQQLRSSCPSAPPSASSSSLPPPAVVGEAAKAERADAPKESSLPREEVVRRLRLLRQPATLFGEDDAARLRRLHDVLEDPAAVADVDAAEIGEGQTNDFLRDIQALRAKVVAAKPKAVGAAERSDGVKEEEKQVPFEELCEEDKIMAFFKRLLTEWSQEVDEMPEEERRTAKGKAVVATCKQCARYLDPLFRLCEKKALPDDVQRALLDVVRCCMRRDYLAATDNYIKLAIGNSPWPIGVTMVGIHERSAREKIHTNSVAHVMNDETTRKYLQSVKRLMTFCQRKYPTDPSRSVEFNSLANGSDLQALMAEKSANGSDETLRLVAAS
ncbi:pre-mRNA-splicing factor 18-like [Lolium rigidum]|uniref:pre-mRNA-splicing factor 18-like n=1 Tax=Lolium rigidum TaxID=89674 RepID=UPI001F5C771F|nr:pre-mRNA-splicing factor 18-like [Lolium rigidum]